MSLLPGPVNQGKNATPVNAPVARGRRPRGRKTELPGQQHIDRSWELSRLLFDALEWIGAELRVRPAGVSAAIVSGVLRAIHRETGKGARPSCTASYQRLAADLASELGKQPGRRQIAQAIRWLKSMGWLDVLNQGPAGGFYAIQWPQLKADVDGKSGRRGAPEPHGDSQAPAETGRIGSSRTRSD